LGEPAGREGPSGAGERTGRIDACTVTPVSRISLTAETSRRYYSIALQRPTAIEEDLRHAVDDSSPRLCDSGSHPRWCRPGRQPSNAEVRRLEEQGDRQEGLREAQVLPESHPGGNLG